MVLDPVGLAGVVVLSAGLASGMTLIAVGLSATGGLIAAAGAASGAALLWLGRARPGARKEAAGRACGEAQGGAVPAGAAGEPLRPGALAQARAQYSPPPGPHQVDTHAAGEAESTVARQFVADQKAHAIPSLSAIYKELQAPGIQAFLICVAGPDRGRGMPVGAEPVTIGRGAHNVFQVHDPGASVTQAQIVWEDGRLFVRDCMSKNGTFVNNARVEQAELSNCDVIAFGDTRILVAMG